MSKVWIRLALGAAAGFAGTMALQALHKTNEKFMPETSPPIKDDPGKFMVNKAEQLLPELTRIRVPVKAEQTAAQLLGLGCGMIFGALYATPQTRHSIWEGLILGLAVGPLAIWVGCPQAVLCRRFGSTSPNKSQCR